MCAFLYLMSFFFFLLTGFCSYNGKDRLYCSIKVAYSSLLMSIAFCFLLTLCLHRFVFFFLFE